MSTEYRTPKCSIIEVDGSKIIKAWNQGVPFEEKAIEQLKNTARMPFVKPYLAAMPDCHWGMGSTVGSVVPTVDAIMPACVGVDIGCGMIAVRVEGASGLDSLPALRAALEKAIPHGRTNNGRPGDRGAWHDIPEDIQNIWNNEFAESAERLYERHPKARNQGQERHLGTLGTGNHFVEVCLDRDSKCWIVIHSGSRGLGNRIGSYFTQMAKEMCTRFHVQLPDPDLAFIPKGEPEFGEYIGALHLAQKFAWRNREIMMGRALEVLGGTEVERVHCHHNFMAEEKHFGQTVLLTRKGAVRANVNDMVIIPGSMGARTYIARGLGSRDSFHSCSHGAGRAMGRNEAKRRFTVEDHIKATEGVECHKGAEVVDETPGAYKDIDAVMLAQTDLIEPVYVLKQIVCVKGLGDK